MPALDGADEERVGEWARSRAPLHALVYIESGFEDLLADAWAAVREVAVGALIPGGLGGKIVLIAPEDDVVVAAALENLARTLSVEWARHGVTVVAVAPGAGVSSGELAELVCYLVSPAGDYFSGCRFDVGLRSVGSAALAHAQEEARKGEDDHGESDRLAADAPGDGRDQEQRGGEEIDL